MAQRQIIFDPHSLLMLLVHYNDGWDLPLECRLVAAGVHPMLDRMIGLQVEAKEWDEEQPLQLRYEGRKMLTWSQKDGENVSWKATPDAPRIL
jgi:hypothetical protein